MFNRRYAYKESKISPKTAPNLRLKWKFYAGRDITATPAIYDGTLYFPSWNGNIYAVKEADGSLVVERVSARAKKFKGDEKMPNSKLHLVTL